MPLFARRLSQGLGFAEDPGTSESFGTARCRLVAEAMWIAFVRGTTGELAIVEEILAHFVLNGIDVAHPHMNPWSVDRYDYGALV